MKEVKETKDKVRLRLNGGELNIAIDRKGNVLEFTWSDEDDKEGWYPALTATQLDQVAAKSRLHAAIGKQIKDMVKQLEGSKAPSETTTSLHEIGFSDGPCSLEDMDGEFDGDVQFGCQYVSAENVARVHNLSRKMRGLKPIK